MIGKSHIRERGTVPRKMRKQHNAASKSSWLSTATLFHAEYRDRRFTESHAAKAGFYKRKRKYEQKKRRMFGHNRPNEFSGDTRAAVRTATVSATSKGGRIRYPGARKLNFKNPKSRIRPSVEFRHIIPEEEHELAYHYDQRYDAGMNEG